MSKWEMVRLGDVCERISDGSHNPPKGIESSDYLMLSSKNIFDDSINYNDPRYLSEEDFYNEDKRTKISINDVLLTIVGTIGRTAVITEDMPKFTLQRSVAVLKPIKDKIESRYMMYMLMSKKPIMEKESRGVAQKGIYLGQIKSLEISLPPLNIQKQIAKNLDTLSELIKFQRQQLTELDNLITSVFYDIFGDPFTNPKGYKKCQLSDLASIIMGQSPKGSSYNLVGEGIPLLNGPSEFGIKYPIEKQWTLEPTKMSQMEDILFCVRGATAGRMNTSDKEYCIGRGLAAIRPKESYMHSYIYLYLKMMYNHFQSTSNGSTFINISKDQLSQLPIIVVDSVTQDKFSKIALKIEDQKALVQKSLGESQYLFDSLMYEYFE